MDEQLQAELISILRELKNGASPAFQEILAQRVTYCWVQTAMYCTWIILSLVCVCWSERVTRGKAWVDGEQLGPRMIFGATIVFALLTTPSFLNDVFESFGEAIAPLGRVMEIMR